MRAACNAYRNTSTPLFLRDRREITAMLGPLTIVQPGLVDVVDWPTPQPEAEPALLYAAVGQVRPQGSHGSLAP